MTDTEPERAPLADSVLALLRRTAGEALGPKMLLSEIDRLRGQVEALSKLNLAYQASLLGDHKLVRGVLEDMREGFTMEGGAIPLFAAACRELLGIAPNYVQLACSDDLGNFFITVQRGDGKTPATMHQEALAEIAELKAKLQERGE